MPSQTALSQLTQGLDALLHAAAYAPIRNTGWIRVTGSDRVRWLNGMVTNNIAALRPGEGNYNFLLNAQGRIQGDCTAFMQEDSILLQTAADRIPALMTMLDHFIIMDDVELADISAQRQGVLISGPEAPAIVGKFGLAVPGNPLSAPFIAPLPHAMSGSAAAFLLVSAGLVPHFELWFAEESGAPHLASEMWAGLPQASPEDLEHLRILSGTPLYGTDIRDKDLPQETNQTRALHFAKGCYLGQEIVERIRSRGQVHRTFSGFLLTAKDQNNLSSIAAGGGPAVALPAPLTLDEKPVGELTSVATIGTQTYALGYIRREAIERANAHIQYPGGTAIPSALPFPISNLNRAT